MTSTFCNLTSALPAAEFLAGYGPELEPFLRPALAAFSPDDLQAWFKRQGLQLLRTREGLVFPRSERAPDVVHLFTDLLRDLGVPLCLNSPVETIEPLAAGFAINTRSFSVQATRVLLATGGVSYPKNQKKTHNRNH